MADTDSHDWPWAEIGLAGFIILIGLSSLPSGPPLESLGYLGGVAFVAALVYKFGTNRQGEAADT